MLATFRRLWCRRWHHGQHTRPYWPGALRCAICGVGFVSPADAGCVFLGPGEDRVSLQSLAPYIEAAARWEATSYRLSNGRQILRRVVIRDGQPQEL